MIPLAELRGAFDRRFRGDCRIFFAPGRVNLIGEHVDYNDGLVLPFAIDHGCHVCARARRDRKLRVYAADLDETAKFALGDGPLDPPQWSSYVRGVGWAIERAGVQLSGADMLVTADLPMGAGLSSSAALELAAGRALLALAEARLQPVRLALLGREAEHEFVGVRCGIMDQLTVACSRRGHALLIDCRTHAVEALPLHEDAVAIVVADTGTRHALAASREYNERRAACEEAVERLRRRDPRITSLRDISAAALEAAARRWPARLRRRARHVVSEIARVERAAAALRAADFTELGRLISASHASLDQDYEVSSPELNRMAALARDIPGCLGARMMGAGFGGSTVNLVRASEASAFIERLAAEYAEGTDFEPAVHHYASADGAAEVMEA